MVQSWIKMRVDLDRHPKVKRMARVLKADRLRVIGGLWAVWALFDAYSEGAPNSADELHGSSGDDSERDASALLEYDAFEDIDYEIRWPGFARAMADVGWLLKDEQGLVAPNYTVHNGPTGKRRAMETKRKAEERETGKRRTGTGRASASRADSLSASDADRSSASDADTLRHRGRGRGREEEEEEKTQNSSGEVTRRASPPGEVCRALKAAGVAGVSPSHPRLLALLDAGATEAEFVDAAPKGVGKADGFAYVLGVVEGRRRDAALARNGLHRGPMPATETTSQREARERVEAAVPSLAPRREAPPMEVVDVVAKRVG